MRGLRLARDRPAHRDALSLASERCAGRRSSRSPSPSSSATSFTRRSICSFGVLANLQAVAEVLADGHVRVERVCLEDHRDVAVPRLQVGHVAVADRDAPVGRLLEPRHDAQERRLART
jgi:hypothetical protein